MGSSKPSTACKQGEILTQQPRQSPLTFGQWQRSKVFAVNPKQIESAEAVRMASGARGFKTRPAGRDG